MRKPVTTVTIRKEGGLDAASVQAAYDAFSDIIDRASPERYKPSLYDAGAVLQAEVIARAPYDPNAKKFQHIRDSVVLSQGADDRPYVIVSVNTAKSPQARWYEYGTVRQPARPFFRPAQQSANASMTDIIVAGVTKAILGGNS